MIRRESYDAGNLVERVEIERIDPSAVEYRRYDDALNIQEQRAATPDEEVQVDAKDAEEVVDQKAANVSQAVTKLRQWAADAANTTVTNQNNTVVTQQIVDRLGIFFDRFADLVESKRLD